MSEPSSVADAVIPSSPSQERVALATTKRKFHRLLEGITGNTPRTKVTAKDPHETAAKRIRVEARSRLDASVSKSIISSEDSSIQTQLLTGRLATASANARGNNSSGSANAASPMVAKEPNYLPWSQDLFLKRLKTFADVRLWTPKPEIVCEVEWAKRGWVCVGWNTVACKRGCEQRVVVSLRPGRKDEEGQEIDGSEDFTVEVDDELVRRYVDLIGTGHDESCLWRDAGCNDDIFRLPIAKTAIWQSQLRERYHSLNSISDQLPPLGRLAHPLDLAQTATQFPPRFLAPQSSRDSSNPEPAPHQALAAPLASLASSTLPPTINLIALAFAVLGWTGSPDPALATCSACFRRLGLWLYATDAENDDHVLQLDLVENHREYCPWVTADSQRMPGSFAGLAAWQILVRLIANNAVRPASVSVSDGSVIRGSEQTIMGRVSNDGVPMTESTTGADQHPAEGETVPETTVVKPKKDTKQIEKEDRARFARLKELTKLMGLKKSKAKRG